MLMLLVTAVIALPRAVGHVPNALSNVRLSDYNYGQGYRQAESNGGIFDYGNANYEGTASSPSPIVGMADTPDNDGYWMASSSGGVYTLGTPTSTVLSRVPLIQSSASPPRPTPRDTGSSRATVRFTLAGTPITTVRLAA